MAIETTRFEYSDGETGFRGQLSRDSALPGLAPGVLIAHSWAGCSEFERDKAIELAKLGYVALAIDLYGDGIVGSGPDENARLMTPFLEDRALLQRRMHAALEALKGLDSVDETRTAGIGFCFGGLCVLDLARTGASIQGVVSFHGLLGAPDNLDNPQVGARVLVLHGWDDPMAQPSSVEALAAEMTAAGADWQVHAYGRTMHAFTNPDANDPVMGTVYDAQADMRSWRAMQDFLADSLAPA